LSTRTLEFLPQEQPESRQVRRARERSVQKRLATLGPVEPDSVTALPRPQINARDEDLAAVAEQVIAAIGAGNQPTILLMFGGLPVRIERDEREVPLLRPVTEDRLRHHIARWIDFYRIGKDGSVPALPPMSVVRDILAHPSLPLPPLLRIVEAPAFDRTGRLCETPGYCGRDSGLFFAPSPTFQALPVSTCPSQTEMEDARSLLCAELLPDFPFVNDAERAHAIALLLLPFARDLIDGPTPLHLIEKPAPGTGAGLLVDVLLWPACGRSVPVMTEGRDEDEWRKRLTAKLSGSPTVLLIDNLRRRLDSAAVSSALTGQIWEDRVLGVSATMRAPIRCAWVATGNNPALSNELTRRTVRIRLDAGMDRPWLREGFRHPDLRGWVTTHRSELVAAALTLIQGWLQAGRPPGTRTMGQFESWARTLGGILGVAGIPGFLDNLETFYDAADDESTQWSAFVKAWADRYGESSVGVAELFRLLGEDIALDLGDRGDRSQRTRLGKLLGRMRDRVFIGYRIVSASQEGKLQRWRLMTVDPLLRGTP
jgi:hypothetical protein